MLYLNTYSPIIKSGLVQNARVTSLQRFLVLITSHLFLLASALDLKNGLTLGRHSSAKNQYSLLRFFVDAV